MANAPAYSLTAIIHKLWVGLCLTCPACEKGRTFTGLFTMQATCPVCGVRFERLSGESVGGMYINLVTAELLTLAGLIVTEIVARPPVWVHLAVWGTFNVLFVLLFYRHSRSMWVAFNYLTSGLTKDGG